MELVVFIARFGVIRPPVFVTGIGPRDTKLWLLPDDNVTVEPG